MGSSKKTAQPQPGMVARLTAQVEALTARLDMLEGSPRHSENGNGQNKAPQSRRDVLKLAGAAAAGAAGSLVLGSLPVAAADGGSITLGTSVGNDASTTTDIWPSVVTTKAPLFQATGQGVPATTKIDPTTSTTAPTTQSIPLIGAIGAGGALPQVGTPPVSDYPGFAPIQGV